jgi:hypothetical protein
MVKVTAALPLPGNEKLKWLSIGDMNTLAKTNRGTKP